MITTKTTIKEIMDTCEAHQVAAKDCESCPIYEFCMQLSCSFPSGWRVKDYENVKVNKV